MTVDRLRVLAAGKQVMENDPQFRLTRDHELFVGFLRHLVDDEDFDAKELVYVVEKPWKWTPEFLAWVETQP